MIIVNPKMKIDNRRRVAVVGIGNILLRDEGIGVHIARLLRETTPIGKISLEVIDGGTSPEVFFFVEGVDKLILIDAVKGGGSPGSVYLFHPEDIVPEEKYAISAHEMDLMYNLKMMELSGVKPKEVVIIGVEPKDISEGMELSPELSDKIPQIMKVVTSELELMDIK
jgi:hydrogenase maturation protease